MGGRGSSAIRENTNDLDSYSYKQTTEWFNNNSNYQDWAEQMLDEEIDDTINKYSGEKYGEINSYLRTGSFKTNDKWYEQSDADRHIAELDKATSTFDLKSPITVYRRSDSEIFGRSGMSYKQMKAFEGKDINDKAYVSASTVKVLPGEQTVGGRVLYKIDVPAGKGNGAYIAKYSENSQEREFLMARNGSYSVKKVTQTKDGVVVTLKKKRK